MRALSTGLLLAALSAAQVWRVETFAGSESTGDGGPATAVVLRQVSGIAVDRWGNLYLADTDDHRVRCVGLDGTIRTVAGTGRAGFAGDGGPAHAAALNLPYGLAVDSAGALFIADLGNGRVRRVGPDGTISTVAGGGRLSPLSGVPAIEASLKAPRNVTVDAEGNLFFSDFGAHRVWQVRPGGMLFAVAGTGERGSAGDMGPAAFAQLNSPAAVAIDRWGALLIADSGNGRVRRVFDGTIQTLPVSPQGPTGLAFDSDQNLYIADPGGNQAILLTAQWVAKPLAQQAHDVAVGPDGDVFFAEAGYVRRIGRGGSTSAIVAGSFAGSPVAQLASSVRLWAPSGVAAAADGSIYVSDTNNHRVLKIGADGSVLAVIGRSGVRGFDGDGGRPDLALLSSPAGLAAVGDILYIADAGNHRIRKVQGGMISTAAGTGQAGFSGDFGFADRARLRSPGAIAADGAGNLLVCDTGNHRVRRILATGIIETVAGTGEPSYSGDGGDATLAALASPGGVAADDSGAIFIADTGNNRIRRVSAAAAAGGRPVIESLPDAPIWRSPRGLAIGADGALLIADADDQRIFRLDRDGNIAALAGNGEAGYGGDGGPALESTWSGPLAIAVNRSGRIFAVDSGNGRVRVISAAAGEPSPAVRPVRVVNAASFEEGPVAPGEIVALFGGGVFGGKDLGVLVNGRPATILGGNANQINVQVPYSIAGDGEAQFDILADGIAVGAAKTTLASAAPGLFQTADGHAVAINQNKTVNSPSACAPRGSILTLYATGTGLTDPVMPDGGVAPWPAPKPRLPLILRIGGYQAELLYAGPAPGYIGLTQINAQVPGGFAPTGVVTVELQAGNASSQRGVTVCTE